MSTDDLHVLAERIRGNELEEQIDAVAKIEIGNLLLLDNPPIQSVLALNVVMHFLSSESAQLQVETALVLTNIAGGSASETRAVVVAGAVPHLVALLRSPHQNVREQAVGALGNIAGDSVHCRDHVLSHGAMPLLLDCFTDMSQVSLVGAAAWALSNFCRGKPQPPFDVVQPALGVLGSLINYDDPEVPAQLPVGWPARQNSGSVGRRCAAASCGAARPQSDHRADAGAALHWQHRRWQRAADAESG
jgi:hypothetical protein